MHIDLHNHTFLCNHATGTPQAYVESAIAKGITTFGFSDHAPMHFDPDYRMRFDQIELYESTISELQNRYANKIEILLGYEVDYLPAYSDDTIFKRHVDYLIGSVHFIDEWGFDNPEFIGRYHNEDIDTIWQRYFDLIEAMAKSGQYDIVGHFDLIKVFKFMPTVDVRLLAKNALNAIKKSNMVIEINGAGLRKPIAETYPSRMLLEETFALDIPITFGNDAHSVDQVGLFTREIEHFAKEVGYTQCATFKARDRKLLNF
ncbi:MAG: histidinol phosphate phosphatase [Sulfurovum sp. PC08-66]|nr:MAG: histidinol phosphate phosphatase [Sulfurovum sp. PC08-66]KIM12514.1 MAG: histidinol phosphate phosphatase [Sulfuricurvum sp. PC08-66]